MIERSQRTYTEKTTSIEQDIEKFQKGILVQRLRRGSKAIIIPTNLEDVKGVTITPMSASAAAVFKDNFYSDLITYKATNSTVSTALTRTASTGFATKQDTLLLSGRKLYIAAQDLAASLYASPSLAPLASQDYWKYLPEFGSNSPNYVILTTRASTATYANVKFAFELRGY